MSNFISWIEYKDEILYMTDRNLETSRGKKLSRDIGFEDIAGHGAIRSFFNIPDGKGTDRESTDFSTPDNFPQDIVRDVKKGLFTRCGVALQILTPPALAEYKKIEHSAWTKYKKIEQPAWAKYKEIEQPAWAEYKEIKQSALAEYKEIKYSAWAKYKEIKYSAFWELAKIKKNRVNIWQ